MKVKALRPAARHDDEIPQVNLTPLIDVVFVILIMFIIISPLMDMERVALAEAPSNKVLLLTPEDMGAIRVLVKKDDTIWFNSRQVDKATLFYHLQQEHSRSPELIPKLFCDKEARFGTYQSIKNMIENSGFHELDLMLQPS